MINLIPNEEKKKKVKDFYFRLMVTLLFVLGFAIITSCVAVLPAYFLSSVKKNLANEKLEIQKNEIEPEINSQIATVVKDLNTKLALVDKTSKNTFFVTDRIIKEVIEKKMPDIKIKQIFYKNEAGAAGKSIGLTGTAPNRERLLLFRTALEADPLFKRVDLPISNFIKGSNIQFYLSLTPA